MTTTTTTWLLRNGCFLRRYNNNTNSIYGSANNLVHSYHTFGYCYRRRSSNTSVSPPVAASSFLFFSDDKQKQTTIRYNNNAPTIRRTITTKNGKRFFSRHHHHDYKTSSFRCMTSKSFSSKHDNDDTTTAATATTNNHNTRKHTDTTSNKTNNTSTILEKNNRTVQTNETTTTTINNKAVTSDPPMLTWVDQYLPESCKPYAKLARIDKPIGTWLLLWPCFWSTALATAADITTTTTTAATLQPLLLLPDVQLLTLFGVGAFVMRGAGCTINDMWDREYDAQVHRTKDRPLVATTTTTTTTNNADGSVVSTPQQPQITLPSAVAFLAAQLSLGLTVLLSLPNTYYCFGWGAASLPLVVGYPLAKRFFPYPQFVLGCTFNWGAFMGWAATYGSMDYNLILPLYGSGVTWTLLYDTIYAHQDKEDDAKLGLQSTALTFGSNEQTQRLILNGLATATWIQWMYLSTQVPHLENVLYQAGVTAAYGHLLWQVKTADFQNPHNLATRFRSNSAVGALVFTSFVAGSNYTYMLSFI